jgi:Flp pilus assembly pilin Flp
MKAILINIKGMASVEYALLAALIAGVIVSAVGMFGSTVIQLFQRFNEVWPK